MEATKTSERTRADYEERRKSGYCWETAIGTACHCPKHGMDAYMESLIARMEAIENRAGKVA